MSRQEIFMEEEIKTQPIRYAIQDDPDYDSLPEASSVSLAGNLPPLEIIYDPQASSDQTPADVPKDFVPNFEGLNKRYYVVGNYGGDCVVCEGKSGGRLLVQSQRAFVDRYLPWQVKVGTKWVKQGRDGEKKEVPVYENAAK